MKSGNLLFVIVLFLMPSATFAASASVETKAFGLIGTWSENCAWPGALRITYSYGFFGNPTIKLESRDERHGVGTLEMEAVSASKVTDEKLKVMVVYTAKDGVKAPKPSDPDPQLYEKFGTKLKMGGITLEKCLN